MMGRTLDTDRNEIHELILSAIDLVSMSRTFSEDELKKIFDKITSTSDGSYRHYAEAVYRFLLKL